MSTSTSTSPAIIDETNVVIAFDFGTSKTGVAYAFKPATTDEDAQVNILNWPGKYTPVKTATDVMFYANGEFFAFGDEAKERLEEIEDWNDIYFFEHFKMNLHEVNNTVNDVMVPSMHHGKEFSLRETIGKSLEYLKSTTLERIRAHANMEIKDDEILYVLTIPAIWNDRAKLFMMETAHRYLKSKKVTLALEPECASIVCCKEASKNVATEIPIGSNYMVLDCGGGTIDIAVHELQNKMGELRNRIAPTGGPWGSTFIDAQMEAFVKILLFANGPAPEEQTWYEQFVRFKLLSKWEQKKLIWKSGESVTIPLENVDKLLIVERVNWFNEGSRYKLKFKPMFNAIVIPAPIVEDWFNYAIDRIVGKSEELLANSNLSIDYIFLVGGFAECSLLKQRVKEFETNGQVKKVIIPARPYITIVQGAVEYGLNPTIIKSRISGLTYGSNVTTEFIHGCHSPEKKTYIDGIAHCGDIFEKFVDVGQELENDKEVFKSFIPLRKDQTTVSFTIYGTPKLLTDYGIHYTTDDGMERLGVIKLDIHSDVNLPPSERKLELRMKFGATVIEVMAHHVHSNTTRSCVIKFEKQ